MPLVPALDLIIDNIEAVLNTIADIGIVHDRIRDTAKDDEFDTLFRPTSGPATNQVRTWMIEVESSDSEEDEAGHLFVTPHTIIIHGYHVFDQVNDSATSFRNLLDLVISAIDRSTTIFPFSAAPLLAGTGVRVTKDFDFLGNVLCHHARIELQVEAEETKP